MVIAFPLARRENKLTTRLMTKTKAKTQKGRHGTSGEDVEAEGHIDGARPGRDIR
jgi:hypothetical protein